MNAKLRHQIQDDRVLITANAERPVSIHVSTREAKRFAWAILADLDPDEAADAGCPIVSPILDHAEPRERQERAAWGTQLQAIIAVLLNGPKDTRRIAGMVRTTPKQAAVQLSKLKSSGVVDMRGGLANAPAVWSLNTPGYEAWMARRGWRVS